jgi:hypothetical protein
VLIALGASALTLDDTLIKMFGTELNTGIRVMVHHLRNTFAHNPLRPKWEIPERYKNSYPIELDDGSKITFDATNLHGDRVEPEHVCGLEFWAKLLRHYEGLVG